ncbi:MAG: hypothetical protein KKF50_02195 [Nanoarchaeota archaeon]|nr:hypothetical protein [Nanoarchaeota archaeon]
MEKSVGQVEKNVSASFAYVKKDMLMLNDAFSDLHDKMQHLSLNHAMLLEEIGKLRHEMAKKVEKKVDKKVVVKKPVAKKVKAKKKDDLTKVEGIGPAIKKLLWKNKIETFKDLSKTHVQELRDILDKKGSMFKMHDPSTWARQAKLASQKKWNELEKLQAKLQGGVKLEKKAGVKKKPMTKTEIKIPKNKEIKKIVKETVTYE